MYIKEGFDGEFGIIKLFKEGETRSYTLHGSLFEESESRYLVVNNPRPLIGFDIAEYRKLKARGLESESSEARSSKAEFITGKKPSELNAEQTSAVEHLTGPALILAGPGTGKTEVITARIAYLIKNCKAEPDRILAITFTNKAAGEMKERLSVTLDEQILNRLTVCTFHAFGLSVIKEFMENCGKKEFLSVIDEDDKKHILSEIVTGKSGITDMSERISEIKQSLIPENDISDSPIGEIFGKYNNILRQSNTFDFDDLITFPVHIFRNYPEILAKYRKRIEWILIDEYQDINQAQYILIKLLMPGSDSNLFVVGDPNQAIYGFRGADVRYIQMFREDYENATVFRLKKSYRCSDSILKASENILKTNQKFLEGLQKGVKIKISENPTDKSEAEFVARNIENMIGGMGFFSIDSQVAEGAKYEGIESLSDFAVLCRTSLQMPVIEKALNDHNIPYQKIGEVPILKQEPVKSILDVYRIISNPENTFLKSRLLKKINISEEILQKLKESFEGKSLISKLELITSICFQNRFKNEFVQSILIDLAKQYEGNEEALLQHILLGTGIDTWKPKTEAVNLMTLHSSKGLEFSCVFITGCEENLIPYSLYEKKTADPEEERRLLYVGMTRAKNYLFLTNARQRLLMGKELIQRRSYFLDEIEKELIETEVAHINTKKKKESDQLELF